MKPFDHKFRQQVEEAFGSYNADHLADAGWNSFVQKHRKSKRMGFIFPLWAKAASVAILLSVAGFFTYRTLNIQEKQQIAQETLALPETQPQQIQSEQVLEEETEVVSTSLPQVAKQKENVLIAESSTEQSIANNDLREMESIEIIGIADSTTALAIVEEQSQTLTPNQFDSTTIDEVEKLNSKTPQTTLSLAQFDAEPDISTEKRTSLLAGFSGMMARVDNMVSTSPGVSVGLYAEHRITNNISIRPGLALARHSYGLETVSTSKNDYFYDAPALDGLSGHVESFENNMDIVAMEIPINFVFKLSERRNRTLFVSAGASTMVYLSQRFTSSYNNVYTRENINTATGELTYDVNRTTISQDNQYGAFNHADFFGLANISAGYSFPFGKSSNMLVEPFVQLPTSEITSSNIRLRFGGVSLKWQFGR